VRSKRSHVFKLGDNAKPEKYRYREFAELKGPRPNLWVSISYISQWIKYTNIQLMSKIFLHNTEQ